MQVTVTISALDKLLDYVASGIGAVGGPMLARWKARRLADARRINAQAMADTLAAITDAQARARDKFASARSHSQVAVTIGREIDARVEFQEEKRHKNIAAVAGGAAEKLRDEEVSEHEVDHDWVARFFADVPMLLLNICRIYGNNPCVGYDEDGRIQHGQWIPIDPQDSLDDV